MKPKLKNDKFRDRLCGLHIEKHNTGISLWNRWDWGVLLVETHPYAPDGTYPVVMISFGFVDIDFECKPIYNYLYFKKYGYYPDN